MELDDVAEAVSDLLAKKEELRPVGKEIAESLESEQRRELADALSQMAVDVVPCGLQGHHHRPRHPNLSSVRSRKQEPRHRQGPIQHRVVS